MTSAGGGKPPRRCATTPTADHRYVFVVRYAPPLQRGGGGRGERGGGIKKSRGIRKRCKTKRTIHTPPCVFTPPSPFWRGFRASIFRAYCSYPQGRVEGKICRLTAFLSLDGYIRQRHTSRAAVKHICRETTSRTAVQGKSPRSSSH